MDQSAHVVVGQELGWNGKGNSRVGCIQVGILENGIALDRNTELSKGLSAGNRVPVETGLVVNGAKLPADGPDAVKPTKQVLFPNVICLGRIVQRCLIQLGKHNNLFGKAGWLFLHHRFGQSKRRR